MMSWLQANEFFEIVCGRQPKNPFVWLHRAELSLHMNDLEAASEMLAEAKRSNRTIQDADSCDEGNAVPYRNIESIASLSPCCDADDMAARSIVVQNRYQFARKRLSSSIACLNAITNLRMDPTNPNDAIQILQRQQKSLEESDFLHSETDQVSSIHG